jgi:hypothetical protein
LFKSLNGKCKMALFLREKTELNGNMDEKSEKWMKLVII